MHVTLYHNPRCSKSRAAKQLLEEQGVEFKIVEYLDQPPSVADLEALLRKLGCSAFDMRRPKEAREAGIEHLKGNDLLHALTRNPRALQRPILVVGDRAVIGRPPELILDLLPG